MITNGALVIFVQNINGWLDIDDPNIDKDRIQKFEDGVVSIPCFYPGELSG